ncbi:AbrB/MazE/SpoVT family DNA-binding domain-containing protein [Methanolobus halotolerans]|nr:AbrB/MazE/SpoVT family DNA-binding domain-containing protein [Methanolobus halotolerans]
MPKLQETKSNQFILTIPKDVCELKGWKKGTELKLVERNGYVCLIEG